MAISKTELNERYKVIINGYVFDTDEISNFSNVNKMVYAEEPQRQLDFSIPDINIIPRGRIPILQVDFRYMKLKTWQKLKKATEVPEFIVSYFDYETGTKVSHLMYLEPQDLDTWTGHSLDRLAVLGKSVVFTATLNPMDEYSISYQANGGIGQIYGLTGNYGEPILLATEGYTRSGYALSGWNTSEDGNGDFYNLGSYIILTRNLVLYAVWESSSHRVLSFDYQGVSQQQLDTNNDNWLASKKVNYTTPTASEVGELPNPKFYLTKEDNLIQVGISNGWWNIPFDWQTNGANYNEWLQNKIDISPSGSIKNYNSETLYTINGNTTIYQHWIPSKYKLTFVSNGGNLISPISTPYNNLIIYNDINQLPKPTKSGYIFGGWYLSNEFQTQFTSLIQPAENLTLYAKWV